MARAALALSLIVAASVAPLLIATVASGVASPPISAFSLLRPSLSLVEVDGALVPIQSGVVYPTFTPQPRYRIYVDLSGEWQVLYDEEGGDLRFKGVRISLAERALEVVELLTRSMLARARAEGWVSVRVPSSNNARGSPREGYQGVAWYRRAFRLPRELLAGRRAHLVFHGVNYIADVWLNGKYLGYHEGGFTPFVFDATEFLSEENELVVRVDNVPWDSKDARGAVIVPYRRCDWWNYGGVYRDVYLELVNETYVARLDAVPVRLPSGEWGLDVRATVVNVGGARRAALMLELYPAVQNASSSLEWSPLSIANLSALLAAQSLELDLPSGVSVHKFSLRGLRVREWSPESPALYVVGLYVIGAEVVDGFYDQVGFREVVAVNGSISLNGRRVFLKGLARHEDYPTVGRALTPEMMHRDLEILKEMGANFLRSAHYPNHPLTYVYADRLGLLVWEEVPVYWFDCWAFLRALERDIPQQMLLEMVFRDYNRPSIVIWGLANECDCRKQRAAYLKRMRDLAKRVDPSRLVSQAIVWDLGDDTAVRAGLDVLGVNAYFGVFYGRLEDLDSMLKRLRSRYPNLPIVISEFGYWSGGGVGEDRQAEYFKRAWEILLRNAELISGAVWWTAFDYDSAITFNTFGALDWHRVHRKALFRAIKEAYSRPLAVEGRGGEVPIEDRGGEVLLPLALKGLAAGAALSALVAMVARRVRRGARCRLSRAEPCAASP